MKKIEDLEFNLTKDMGYTLINALKIKERLEEGRIDNEEREELEKEINTLKNTFIRNFRKNNKYQINQYNEFINNKNRELN